MEDKKNFEKPTTMGPSLENGYFSEEGTAGFNMSYYAGRLNIKFWKKGEKSSENRDNTLSLNPDQYTILTNILYNIVNARKEARIAGGIENYPDISNIALAVTGVVNGQPLTFATIKFDTIEINGIKRVQMTVARNTTVNTIVFCSKYAADFISNPGTFGNNEFDALDVSLTRFYNDLANLTNFTWSQAAFNKLFQTVIKPTNGGGNNYSGGKKPSYSNSGANRENNASQHRYEEDDVSSLFGDDDF